MKTYTCTHRDDDQGYTVNPLIFKQENRKCTFICFEL